MSEAKDWPRTAAGTLRCPCGKSGQIFVSVGAYLTDDLEYRGALGGYCSDACADKGSKLGHPVPAFADVVEAGALLMNRGKR